MDNPSPSWQRIYADEEFSWLWPPAYEPGSTPPELESISLPFATAKRCALP